MANATARAASGATALPYWRRVEDAIRSWVVIASGLPEQRVAFKWQERTAPPEASPAQASSIVIGLPTSIAIGEPVRSSSTDLGQPLGREVELRADQLREIGITVESYTGEVTGGASARELLQRVQEGLELLAVQARLEAEGVSVFDAGPINFLPAIPSVGFEGRGLIEFRAYATGSVAERVGYIETAELAPSLS